MSGTISGAGGSGATVNLTGASTASVTANASGVYSFTGLANGNYTVTPTKSGFVMTPASLAVTISGANATANFTSAQTFTLSGTISGSGGSGATVSLSGASTATTTANASGVYSFTGLANGNYTVTPTKSGFVMTPASLAVTISGANATANFTSGQTFTLSGTISGAGGSGATVEPERRIDSDNDGQRFWRVQLHWIGQWQLHGDADEVRLRDDACEPGGHDQWRERNCELHFCADLYVERDYQREKAGSGATVNLTTKTASTTANASGVYSFTGLVNGSYTVTPTKLGFVMTPVNRAVRSVAPTRLRTSPPRRPLR